MSGDLGGKIHGVSMASDDAAPVELSMVGTPARMSSKGAMPNVSARDG